MKTYRITGAQSHDVAAIRNPDRSATKRASGNPMDFDVIVGEWSNRSAMARSVRMQQRRERRPDDWRPFIALTDGEGY